MGPDSKDPDGTTGVGWSEIADWYDVLVRSGRSPHALAVATTLALAGDVAGLRVLDVACGQGAATRALAAAGAEVTGGRITGRCRRTSTRSSGTGSPWNGCWSRRQPVSTRWSSRCTYRSRSSSRG